MQTLMEVCWGGLPVTFLQGLTRHLSVRDATTARLTCQAWARSIPLPRTCINWRMVHSQQKEIMQSYWDLLGSMQQPDGSARLAQQCIITLPQSMLQAGTCVNQHQQKQQHIHCGQKTLCTETESLLATLSSMPCLDNLVIRTTSVEPVRSTTRGDDLDTAVLVRLLLGLLCHGLHQKLQKLTLSLKAWPAPGELNPVLVQLTALRALTLQHCPLASVCSLPCLTSLTELSISGIVSEPVPPSYSFRRRGPLLPPLPSLKKLTLRQLPLDVRVYEAEDIQRQDCQLMQLDQQQQQAGFTAGCRQWIGSSIVCQCPNLRVLSTDMELGPVLLQLKSLTVLHGAHPSWLRAAAAAGMSKASMSDQHPQHAAPYMTELPSQPEVQQLRCLAVGLAAAEDLHLVAQLKGLVSLRTWQSVTLSQQSMSQSSKHPRCSCCSHMNMLPRQPCQLLHA